MYMNKHTYYITRELKEVVTQTCKLQSIKFKEFYMCASFSISSIFLQDFDTEQVQMTPQIQIQITPQIILANSITKLNL